MSTKAKNEPMEASIPPTVAEEGDQTTTSAIRSKFKHSHGDARSFFLFFYLKFLVRIIGGVLGLVLGIMLLIAGSWAETGIIAILALDQGPWPGIEIEDFTSHEFSIAFTQHVGRIAGSILLLISLYFFVTAKVLYDLLFDKDPWNQSTWSAIRREADKILVQSEVRDEAWSEQMSRMSSAAQENMSA